MIEDTQNPASSDSRLLAQIPTNQLFETSKDLASSTSTPDLDHEETPPSGRPECLSSAVIPLPHSIKDHSIIRELGRGGMGIVYLAREARLGREVALKIVPPGMGPLRVKRFLEEATLTGRLQHPAIVPIYRIGKTEDGRDFYTMKRVQGRNLSLIIQALRDGDVQMAEEFSDRRLAAILLAVCEGVAYAHDRGIIHRDLKPGNIMIGEYGEVYILDWGLAKPVFGAGDANFQSMAAGPTHLHRETKTSTQQTVSGTPAYMSPEQARGEESVVDQRSDVWSLGAILYAILTYHAPIDGKSPSDKLVRAAQGKVTPPETYPRGRQAARELREILDKALRKEAPNRYPHAHAMAMDLKAYLDGRGRWQQTFAWNAESDSFQADEWVKTMGSWKCGTYGLSPAENSPQGAILLSAELLAGDVRIEIDATALDRKDFHPALGLLLSAPDADDSNVNETDGYLFTLGVAGNGPARLIRNNVDVVVTDDVQMPPSTRGTIAAERVGSQIRTMVNNQPAISFFDLFPLSGHRLGVFARGASTHISAIRIYRRGIDVKVSCLAVPDHDFEQGRFVEAAAGYVRISEELAGREEGWLARFKAGISRLESDDPNAAELEFRLLDGTAGEALAHLGRSLLSARQGDYRCELLKLSAAFRVYTDPSMQAYVLARIWMRTEKLMREGLFEAAVQFLKSLLTFETKGNSRYLRALGDITECLLCMDYEEDALHHLHRLADECGPCVVPYHKAFCSTVQHFQNKALWDRAIKLCHSFSQRKEIAALALFLEAETTWIAGNTIGSASALKTAFGLVSDSRWSQLLVLQGKLDLDKGLLRDGQKSLAEAMALEQTDGFHQIAIEHAWLYAMRGKPDRALAALARYLDAGLHATRMEVLAEIGTLSLIRGDWEHARDCLSQTLANLPPSGAEELFQSCELKLGILHLATELVDDAQANFHRAASHPKSTPLGLVSRAILSWSADAPIPEPPEPSFAFPWSRRAEYFFYLGEFSRVSEHRENAVRAYRRALIEAPTPYRKYAWLSHVRLAQLGIKLNSGAPLFPKI